MVCYNIVGMPGRCLPSDITDTYIGNQRSISTHQLIFDGLQTDLEILIELLLMIPKTFPVSLKLERGFRKRWHPWAGGGVIRKRWNPCTRGVVIRKRWDPWVGRGMWTYWGWCYVIVRCLLLFHRIRPHILVTNVDRLHIKCHLFTMVTSTWCCNTFLHFDKMFKHLFIVLGNVLAGLTLCSLNLLDHFPPLLIRILSYFFNLYPP